MSEKIDRAKYEKVVQHAQRMKVFAAEACGQIRAARVWNDTGTFRGQMADIYCVNALRMLGEEADDAKED